MEHFNKFSRLALFAFLLAISAIVFSCDDSPVVEPGAQQLKGEIINPDGAPLKDAFIGVVDESDAVIDSAITDSEGAFVLTGVPTSNEKLSLLVVHKDFSAIREKLGNFFNKKLKKFPIKLNNDSCCGKLEVQVFKKSDSTAVQNAQVKLSVGNVTLKVLQTGDNGKAVFENLCFMKYWIRVAKDGYKVVEEDFTINNCDPKVIKVYIDTKEKENPDSCCHGVIYFTSQNEEGIALKDVSFRLKKFGGDVREGKTSDNGMYVFTGMCPGKYQINYSKDGYKGGEFEFEMGCNDTIYFTKKLTVKSNEDTCCKGKIKIMPREEGTDIQLNGAKIAIWKGSTKLVEKVVQNGYALFENLCEGKYAFEIFAENYKRIEFAVELDCNKIVTLEKGLKKETNNDSCCKGIVIIKVKNANGEYLKNVNLKLWKGGAVIGQYKTSDNGSFIFTKMCPGKYGINFQIEGYKPAEMGFELGCNDTLELTKELVAYSKDTCCTAKLKLRIREVETETFIAGARVEVYLNDQIIRDPNSGEEGWAVAEGLCAPANYKVVIKKEGYVTKTFEFTFKECNVIMETIKLPKIQ